MYRAGLQANLTRATDPGPGDPQALSLSLWSDCDGSSRLAAPPHSTVRPGHSHYHLTAVVSSTVRARLRPGYVICSQSECAKKELRKSWSTG